MSILRINIVLGPFLPSLPGPAGAVEKVWQGIGEHLATGGHDVTLVEKSGVSRDKGKPAYVQVAGYERPRHIAKALALDFAYSQRVLAVLPEADITVSNTFFLPTAAMELQRRAQRKRIGLLIPNIQRMPKGQCRFLTGVAAIMTVSNAARERIGAELGRSSLSNRIFVVPNPVDTNVFRSDDRAPSSKTPTLLFAGRIAPEKGIHVLIDAFIDARAKGLPTDIELVIVGPHAVNLGGGGDVYLDMCKAKASGHPVRFVPSISSPSLLADKMRAARLFVYPSLAEQGETFGVSVLEAMACGSVPIVSDLACFRDFVRAGENGIVFDHRSRPVETLATALIEASCPDLQAKIAANAVQTAQAYSYEAVAERYLALFRDLLANGEAPSGKEAM